VEWDRLTEEVRLHGVLSAQLTAALQRETEACRDTEEIHGMFEDLSARVKLDEEVAARVRKEWDKLLQKDAKACQRVIDLLAEVERERDLKLEAEERSVALLQKANLDAEVVARLRRERDELHQTIERLHLESSTACEEHDQAIRERDEARQGSAPYGWILEPWWPEGWRPRASLSEWAWSSLRCGGFFRLRVMSMISCVLPSGWFLMT